MARVSDGEEEKALDRMIDPEPNAIGVPSTELSLGGMLASRARLRFTRREGDIASESRKQDQSGMPVREGGKCVAKEGPFFVQRMGSTSVG
jgi:hypothetical protein